MGITAIGMPYTRFMPRWLAFVVVVGCSSPRTSEEACREAPRLTPPTMQAAPEPTTTQVIALALLATASWRDVRMAKLLLAGDRRASLAPVVEMIDRDDRVPLTDTADLIYPGAKKFYGHGGIESYDLDHIGDRAGWVLEDLTFRDFGFSDGIDPFTAEDPAHARTRRAAARAAVRGWWKLARNAWRCYDALGDALRSPRTALAYAWLRTWKAPPCDGFTPERFKRELLPIVQKHAADPGHPMHAQAKLLLRDLDEQLARIVLGPTELIKLRLQATTAATTVPDITAALGKPARDIGSGIHIFVYPLPDSAEVHVGSPDATSIMYIRIVDHGRATVLYPR